jgi:DNA-binding NtrC family response regulator
MGSEVPLAARQDRPAEGAAAIAPVLITGERGTGKRLVAQLIHERPWRGGRFVDAVCAHGLPELIEFELFGGMASPFPGPSGPPAGRLEQARLGTCFLHDVHVLPTGAQDLLLRYCETGEVRCLSTWFRPPPARIVAATSVSLEAEARAGRFREDLLRVLMQNAIELRPLRQRPEDVLPIFTYYLDAYSYWTRRPLPAVPDAVRDELLAHQWPGNIDELKHLAARAVLTGSAEGLLAEPPSPTSDWRELVELMWTDDNGGRDPVTCGIYLSDRGLETFMSYRNTHNVHTNLITARVAAQEMRRDFLLSERRYEEFVSVAREW